MTSLNLCIYNHKTFAPMLDVRDGEAKFGEAICLLNSSDPVNLAQSLATARNDGARYALLGIPEDIGPRANLGRGGSDRAWDVFLRALINTQNNGLTDPSKLLLVGHLVVSDLMKLAENLPEDKGAQVSRLRDLCAEIDNRLSPVIEAIVRAGLTPIVVGGGHNNAYPIIHGTLAGMDTPGQKIACVNCDPHADFRRAEGRHSGNGFSFAYGDGLLGAYYVFGLHESYNSEEMLTRFDNAGFRFKSFDEMMTRKPESFRDGVQECISYLHASGLPIGIELDLDSIAGMPTSARSPVGFSPGEASSFLHSIASSFDPVAYLHLPEGAPALGEDGERTVGRALAYLVLTFLKARG